jgi:hypothetical protein
MALGSTPSLTEMSTRDLRRSEWQADFLENVGVWTYHSTVGLHGLLQGQLYLTLRLHKKIVPGIQKLIFMPLVLGFHRLYFLY